MKRIGWQGASRAGSLAKRLNERLASWREGWLHEQWTEAVVVQAERSGMQATQSPRQCWKLDVGGAALWCEADADVAMQLGRGVLKLDGAGSDSLIRRIGADCFGQLCAGLWGGAEPDGLVPSDPACADERNPRYGALGFRILDMPGSIEITASRAWCELQAPPPGSDRAVVALTGRRVALGPTPVALSATIDLGEIPLTESLGWSVGELLVTDAPTEPPVVLTAAQEPVGAGILGADQGLRLVVIS